MTKRIISIMLALVLVFASATVVIAEQNETTDAKAIVGDKCGDNLMWYLADGKNLFIEGAGDMYDYSLENPAPWAEYKNSIATIRLLSKNEEGKTGATSIGNYAFYGMSNVELIEIEGTDLINRIGSYAFYGCTSVPNIINYYNFTYYAEIGEYAFAECAQLRSFPLPESMAAIPEGAFMNCTSLTDIYGKTNAWFINDKAFYNCTSLNNFDFSGISWTIGDYAFYNCRSITSVDLSGTCVDHIGAYAFANCGNVNSVTLSSTPVSSVGPHAFEGDVNITEVEIPGLFTTIDQYAFAGCTSINSLDLSNVDVVGERAFQGCSNLTTVQFDDGLKRIKDWAFANSGLSGAIYLPITLEHIGENAFYKTNVEDLYVYNKECMLNSDLIGAESGAANPSTLTVHGFINSTAQNLASEYGYTFTNINTEFVDVGDNTYYTVPVTYSHYKGWFSGTGPNCFSPYETMTRAMLVTVLWRMAGRPTVQTDLPFYDVPHGAYYEKAVKWAYVTGVTAGTSQTTFDPNVKITREQLATFLYRFAEYSNMSTCDMADLSRYSDEGQIASWAKTSMEWAVANGIITGTSETTLSPKGNAQRCQAVTMLVRYIINVPPCLIK